MAHMHGGRFFSLATTGNPMADGHLSGDKAKSGLVMSPSAGADGQKTLVAQISLAHNCEFWAKVNPKP